MRIVLDTNVIVSAIMFGGVPEKLVIKVLTEDHEVVLSPYIVEEVNRILAEKFGTSSSTEDLFNELVRTAEMKYFQPFLDIVQDGPDNRIIETAVKGRASVIVTGDKQLLELKNYQDILITMPALLVQALKLTLQ